MGERDLMRAYRAATEPDPQRARRLRPRPPRGWRGVIAGIAGIGIAGGLAIGSKTLVGHSASADPPMVALSPVPGPSPSPTRPELDTRSAASRPVGPQGGSEGTVPPPAVRPRRAEPAPHLDSSDSLALPTDAHPPPALPVPGAAPDPGPVALPAGRSAPVSGAVTLADGIGRVDSAGDPLVLTWIVGTLDVTTAPGLTVRVSTDDATVTAQGADLRIHRDALGTDVIARADGVTVTCGTGPGAPLPAGGHHLCLPTTAAGWLGRAQALEGRAVPAEVVAATDAGLAYDAPPAVRAELLTVRLRGLIAAGRSAEALDAVRAYLAEGHPERRDAVRQIGVALADRAGACDEALRWAEGAADPALSRCRR